ncbi:MAG: hypothetical protein ACK5UO_11545, partial [Microcystis sp.]|uniref:hypothetical protein n=1 Tax=Microcystis sp. TaxID=1127 RepID=UPI003919D593
AKHGFDCFLYDLNPYGLREYQVRDKRSLLRHFILVRSSNAHFEKNQIKFSYLNRGTCVEALFFDR